MESQTIRIKTLTTVSCSVRFKSSLVTRALLEKIRAFSKLKSKFPVDFIRCAYARFMQIYNLVLTREVIINSYFL